MAQLYYSLPAEGEPPNAASLIEQLIGQAISAKGSLDSAERLRMAVQKGLFVHDDLAAISALLQAAAQPGSRKEAGTSISSSLDVAALPSTLADFLKFVGAKPRMGVLPSSNVKEVVASKEDSKPIPSSYPANKTLGAMTEEEREAWREAMRSRAAHRDYNTLTSDVRWREVEQARAEGFATYKQQLSIGLNVLVSLITACVFGYFMGKHLVDQHNKAGPWIVAAAFGVILLMVEAILIVTRLGKADSDRKQLQERALQGDPDALAATQASFHAPPAAAAHLPSQLPGVAAPFSLK